MREERDGRIRFTVRTPLTAEFRRWVFHYGSEIEILATPGLRGWIWNEAAIVAVR